MNSELRKKTAASDETCSAKRTHRVRKGKAVKMKRRKVKTSKVQIERKCKSRTTDHANAQWPNKAISSQRVASYGARSGGGSRSYEASSGCWWRLHSRHGKRNVQSKQSSTLRTMSPPRRASASVIGKANPPTLELAFENPVLFLDVGDHVLLVPVDPARQRNQQKLPCLDWLHENHYTQAQPVIVSSYKTSDCDRVNIWTLRRSGRRPSPVLCRRG